MSEQNKATSRKFLEAFAVHDVDVMREIATEGIVTIDFSQGLNALGFDQTEQVSLAYSSAFPGLTFSFLDQIADEDERKVTTVWTASGAHTGDLFGIPATNKDCTIGGISVDYYNEEGRVVRSFVSPAVSSLLMQLGVLPTPNA